MDFDAGVALQAGAGANLLADDDVLLQAQQRIGLALDGRLGQHPGGLLEGGRGQEGLGGQRRLGDAQQRALRGGRTAAGLQRPAVGLIEAEDDHQRAGQQVGVEIGRAHV